MNPDEARKLLGGYATGSLTDQERVSLFEAALDDQELFDQLAEEDALRELIDGPGVRDRLVTSLAPPLEPKSVWAWLWRPWPLTGLAGTIAAVIILWVALPRPKPAPIQESEVQTVPQASVQQPVEIAQNRNDAPVEREARRLASPPPIATAPVRATPPPTLQAAVPSSPAPAPQGFVRQDAAPERDVQVTGEATLLKTESGALASNITPSAADSLPILAIGGAPSDSLSRSQLLPGSAAMPPAAAPPPATAARGGGKGGAAARGPGAVAGFGGAAFATVNLQFGFRYQVQAGSLQVTPNTAGWLTIRGVGDGPSVVIFATGQVPALSPLKFDIPPNAQRLTIEFAVGEASPIGAVDQRTELQGAAAIPNPTENSHLAISIPARP